MVDVPKCRCGATPTEAGLSSVGHKLRPGNRWIYVHRADGHDLRQVRRKR